MSETFKTLSVYKAAANVTVFSMPCSETHPASQ